jgi:hypothetical protein
LLGTDEGSEALGRDEISALVKIILRNRINAKAKLHLAEQSKRSRERSQQVQVQQVQEPGVELRPPPDLAPVRPTLRGLSLSGEEGELSVQEVNVITGVLSLSSISVRSACVRMNKVNMLASDQLLNQQTIDLIHQVGHSRLPVFRSASASFMMLILMMKCYDDNDDGEDV